MTTFQAIVYSILHGFTEFLPIGSTGHDILVPYLTGWHPPEGAFAGALTLGAFLSVLVYFRHDWASIISCFIQVIIFRKKPMTLDERMPLFLTATSIPTFATWYYFRERIADFTGSPLLVAGLMAAFSIPLWLTESMSRKNKGMFDWTIFDAFIVGISQILMLIPGCGQIAASLPGAFLRNFNREAAAKYVFFAMAPSLGVSTYLSLREVDFHAAVAMDEVSWLTFYVTVVVTFLTGLLAIGGFTRHVQRNRFGQYMVYRWVLALVVCGVYWARNRA